MGLKTNIQPPRKFFIKKCARCGQDFGPENYSQTKSFFFPDGYLSICNDCIDEWLRADDYSWDAVNKLCQCADIPFIPKKWEEMYEINGKRAFQMYAEIFLGKEYEGIHWSDYNDEFRRLKDLGGIEEQLPLISDNHRHKLKEKWGANYDDEALNYLENLYNGLLMTQNVSGALQGDQALKICKISYELDSRIRAGQDFDKMLSSYDKLVKTAEFTPKNVKSASDFESVGELFRWLEKRGWKNQFYDDVTKDIVDETIMNIQNWNQRLYTNETGIGEQITERIEALKSAKRLEETGYYGLSDQEYDLDEYDNVGYEELFKADEEFEEDIGDDLNV